LIHQDAILFKKKDEREEEEEEEEEEDRNSMGSLNELTIFARELGNWLEQ
jgi:hypothetical protein